MRWALGLQKIIDKIAQNVIKNGLENAGTSSVKIVKPGFTEILKMWVRSSAKKWTLFSGSALNVKNTNW